MSVIGKGRRRGRMDAYHSGLFSTSGALAIVLLTANPAGAQAPGEDNRNPNALPKITVETKKPRRPPARRGTPGAQPNPNATQTVQQPVPPSPVPSGPPRPGQGAAPTINLGVPSSTGSRLNLTPLQTPASVEIITSETIAERGQHDVNNAVTQNAAGFTGSVSNGTGGLSFTTRGFSGLNSVMTLYDGTRFYVGASTLTFPFDSWSADKIEVLRGPASVLYGEGAIGGAINVIPKNPLSVQSNELDLWWDTNNTKRIAIDSGGPINNDVTYRIAATGNVSDGWVDHDYSSNAAVSAAVRVQQSENFAWELSTDVSNRRPSTYYGTPLINGQLDTSLRFKNFDSSDANILFQDTLTRLKADWQVSDNVTIHNVLYDMTSDRHWRDVETYTWNPATALVNRTGYFEIFHKQDQVGDRMDATIRGQILGFKNEFVEGFDVNRIYYAQVNNSPYTGFSAVNPFTVFNPGLWIEGNPPLTVPAYHTVTNEYALFAEDRFFLTPQWTIVGGVRYDQPNISETNLENAANSFEKSFYAISWRAGTVYTPFPDFSIYGQYATGADPVASLISLAATQQQFQLSTGKQTEVGVKQLFWNGRGEWTLAGYEIVKNNLLAIDPNNPAVTDQIGQQSSRGVEATLGLVLDGGWRIDANTALLRARFDDFTQAVGGKTVNYAGNVPNNVPETVSNVWLTWKFAPDWQATGGVQIVGDTWADNANTLKRPAYTVVNTGLQWKPYDNTTLTLRVYNLFDTAYALSGGTTQWLLGRPRTFELALRLKF